MTTNGRVHYHSTMKGGRGEGIWEGHLRRSRGVGVRKKKGLKPGEGVLGLDALLVSRPWIGK